MTESTRMKQGIVELSSVCSFLRNSINRMLFVENNLRNFRNYKQQEATREFYLKELNDTSNTIENNNEKKPFKAKRKQACHLIRHSPATEIANTSQKPINKTLNLTAQEQQNFSFAKLDNYSKHGTSGILISGQTSPSKAPPVSYFEQTIKDINEIDTRGDSMENYQSMINAPKIEESISLIKVEEFQEGGREIQESKRLKILSKRLEQSNSIKKQKSSRIYKSYCNEITSYQEDSCFKSPQNNSYNFPGCSQGRKQNLYASIEQSIYKKRILSNVKSVDNHPCNSLFNNKQEINQANQSNPRCKERDQENEKERNLNHFFSPQQAEKNHFNYVDSYLRMHQGIKNCQCYHCTQQQSPIDSILSRPINRFSQANQVDPSWANLFVQVQNFSFKSSPPRHESPQFKIFKNPCIKESTEAKDFPKSQEQKENQSQSKDQPSKISLNEEQTKKIQSSKKQIVSLNNKDIVIKSETISTSPTQQSEQQKEIKKEELSNSSDHNSDSSYQDASDITNQQDINKVSVVPSPSLSSSPPLLVVRKGKKFPSVIYVGGNKKFQCQICKKTFDSKQKLGGHKARSHPDAPCQRTERERKKSICQAKAVSNANTEQKEQNEAPKKVKKIKKMKKQSPPISSQNVEFENAFEQGKTAIQKMVLEQILKIRAEQNKNSSMIKQETINSSTETQSKKDSSSVSEESKNDLAQESKKEDNSLLAIQPKVSACSSSFNFGEIKNGEESKSMSKEKKSQYSQQLLSKVLQLPKVKESEQDMNKSKQRRKAATRALEKLKEKSEVASKESNSFGQAQSLLLK